MNVLFDNNMPPRLAYALDILLGPAGHHVTHIRKELTDDIDDIEWISTISRRKDWVVFTYDRAIQRRPHEREALMRTDLKVCFFTAAWQSHDALNQSWRMIKYWDRIVRAVEQAAPASSITVQIGGSTSVMLRS